MDNIHFLLEFGKQKIQYPLLGNWAHISAADIYLYKKVVVC